MYDVRVVNIATGQAQEVVGYRSYGKPSQARKEMMELLTPMAAVEAVTGTKLRLEIFNALEGTVFYSLNVSA